MKKKRAFDWESARLRIAAASAALEELSEYNQEVIQQIWARRAEQLAQIVEEEDQGEQIELVIVYLGCELYALEAQYIFDIRPLDRLTRVPRTPDWIAGVINQRGHILSVIDLQQFFGLPETECAPANASFQNSQGSFETRATSDGTQPTRSATPSPKGQKQLSESQTPYLIVIEVSEMQLALLTGAVLTVQDIPATQIQEAAGMVLNINSEYVHGVIEYGRSDGPGKSNSEEANEKAIVIVLDLPTLLEDKQLLIYEELV